MKHGLLRLFFWPACDPLNKFGATLPTIFPTNFLVLAVIEQTYAADLPPAAESEAVVVCP